MDLSHYIEDLLYSNDCVIIPAIGGFIVNYTPATIDFIEQQVYPPKKLVAFNPKLVNNDGLLANYIVQKEHLTYKQANQKVEEYIRQIEDDLFNNRLAYFNNIGKLYFNADSKLEFVPENTNFNIDAYGLPSLNCLPILRSKDYLIKDQQTAENKKIVVKKREKSINVFSIVSKPQALGLAAALILLVMSPYIYNALFNSPIAIENNIAQNDNNKTKNTLNDSNKTNQNASIIPSLITTENKVDSVVETPENKENSTTNTASTDNKDNQEYVIVLGAFSKKLNADRMAKQLEKDNYLPDVTPKNGLTRVGVIISCTPEELKKHLQFLQDNYNKKAWVVE